MLRLFSVRRRCSVLGPCAMVDTEAYATRFRTGTELCTGCTVLRWTGIRTGKTVYTGPAIRTEAMASAGTTFRTQVAVYTRATCLSGVPAAAKGSPQQTFAHDCTLLGPTRINFRCRGSVTCIFGLHVFATLVSITIIVIRANDVPIRAGP